MDQAGGTTAILNWKVGIHNFKLVIVAARFVHNDTLYVLIAHKLENVTIKRWKWNALHNPCHHGMWFIISNGMVQTSKVWMIFRKAHCGLTSTLIQDNTQGTCIAKACIMSFPVFAALSIEVKIAWSLWFLWCEHAESWAILGFAQYKQGTKFFVLLNAVAINGAHIDVQSNTTLFR